MGEIFDNGFRRRNLNFEYFVTFGRLIIYFYFNMQFIRFIGLYIAYYVDEAVLIDVGARALQSIGFMSEMYERIFQFRLIIVPVDVMVWSENRFFHTGNKIFMVQESYGINCTGVTGLLDLNSFRIYC